MSDEQRRALGVQAGNGDHAAGEQLLNLLKREGGMPSLWAISITALSPRRPTIEGQAFTINKHGAAVVSAVNHDEAIGKGMRIAEKVYPPRLGWSAHHVMARSCSEVIVDFDTLVEIQP